MEWTYIIQQKMRAATVLAVVFGLILITNRLEKSYFSELQTAFTSVYQDRLVVERYIYQLAGLLHRKKELTNESSQKEKTGVQEKRENLNDAIESLVDDQFARIRDDLRKLLETTNLYELATGLKAELTFLKR